MIKIEDLYNEIIKDTRNYFNNAHAKTAVIGISGGKDSTVSAKLLVDALGKDNVYGVLMPNGEQSDFSDALKVVKTLGIRYSVINIESMYDAFLRVLPYDTEDMRINLAPRIRMTTLYGIAQGLGKSLVINTCNYSEDVVGYATKFGDCAGDYSLLSNLTVSEVVALGDYLGLPNELVHKTPSDGLCGQSDEDKLGVTYDEIEDFIYERLEDPIKNIKIKNMMIANKHKILNLPSALDNFDNEEFYKRFDVYYL